MAKKSTSATQTSAAAPGFANAIAALTASPAPVVAKPGAAKFQPSAVITWSSKAPAAKRGASAARYAAYQSTKTVAAYLAAGGTRADLAWDSAPTRGFITITA